MTLINGISPPLYFPSVSLKTPGVLLCPEALNIHISIILIFKSIKWIAHDKTNSNYLCSDREIYLVSLVTAGETWGWMSAALLLLCLFFILFFFYKKNSSCKASLNLKENRWHSLWRVWKWDIHLKKKKKLEAKVAVLVHLDLLIVILIFLIPMVWVTWIQIALYQPE